MWTLLSCAINGFWLLKMTAHTCLDVQYRSPKAVDQELARKTRTWKISGKSSSIFHVRFPAQLFTFVMGISSTKSSKEIMRDLLVACICKDNKNKEGGRTGWKPKNDPHLSEMLNLRINCGLLGMNDEEETVIATYVQLDLSPWLGKRWITWRCQMGWGNTVIHLRHQNSER